MGLKIKLRNLIVKYSEKTEIANMGEKVTPRMPFTSTAVIFPHGPLRHTKYPPTPGPESNKLLYDFT